MLKIILHKITIFHKSEIGVQQYSHIRSRDLDSTAAILEIIISFSHFFVKFY